MKINMESMGMNCGKLHGYMYVGILCELSETIFIISYWKDMCEVPLFYVHTWKGRSWYSSFCCVSWWTRGGVSPERSLPLETTRLPPHHQLWPQHWLTVHLAYSWHQELQLKMWHIIGGSQSGWGLRGKIWDLTENEKSPKDITVKCSRAKQTLIYPSCMHLGRRGNKGQNN